MSLSSGQLFAGPRVRLTALLPEDALHIARWYEDSTFARLYDGNAIYPFAESRVRGIIDTEEKSSTSFPFAIRTLYSDDIIGQCAVDGISWTSRSGWVSIAIGEAAHRGMGLGEEAMRLLMRFCFDEINLNRIQLTVFTYNDHARRLYEKLGFVHEGTWRESVLRDGQAFDALHFGMLAREWRALPG